jgi:alanine racemase
MTLLYQTHARIHLDHIQFNLAGIRAAVGAERKILIAVKANAYGHGAVPVARLAERIGVDWLGVATVPEGIELREAGIGLPVLKFSPAFPAEMDAALRSGITLAVAEQANIHELDRAAQSAGVTGRVHLKVGTGMGRIGVTPADAPALAAFIERECPHLYLEGIFTHLPVSDAADPTYTQAQVARFAATVAAVQAAVGRKLDLVHAANSGAVLAHPQAWFDMVRPGIMIYGFYPDEGTPRTIPLKPGLSFATRISFLKRVTAGTSIGYGRTWVAERDTWIATFPAGYADGFNRLFSNRGRVLINGRSCPVVGRVCMDQSMADLGPEPGAQVSDEVVLIGRSGGEEITADEWAEKLGTITYEVTCQINARVPRVYGE